MRRIARAAGAALLLLAVAGCGGGGDPQPSPGQPSSTVPVDSIEAFQAFSGMTVPSTASKVTLQVTSAFDKPAYRVGFNLPSADLDAFCRTGKLDSPLPTQIIPDVYRETFDYKGDSSTGIAVSNGSLPGDLSIQRRVFAIDTKKTVAKVQIYSYRMPSR